MYKIERISEKHLNDWIQMMLELWEDNTYELLKTEHVNLLNDDKYGNFICYKDEEALGFINMSKRHDYVPGAVSYPIAYIEGIYVRAQYRRTGIAKMLIDHAEKWAAECGCKQVASDHEIDNALSYNFHKGMGFREVERVICFVKELREDK